MFKLKLIKEDISPLKVNSYWRYEGGEIFKIIKVTNTDVWFAWVGFDAKIEYNTNGSGGLTRARWNRYVKDGTYKPVLTWDVNPRLIEFILENQEDV